MAPSPQLLRAGVAGLALRVKKPLIGDLWFTRLGGGCPGNVAMVTEINQASRDPGDAQEGRQSGAAERDESGLETKYTQRCGGAGPREGSASRLSGNSRAEQHRKSAPGSSVPALRRHPGDGTHSYNLPVHTRTRVHRHPPHPAPSRARTHPAQPLLQSWGRVGPSPAQPHIDQPLGISPALQTAPDCDALIFPVGKDVPSLLVRPISVKSPAPGVPGSHERLFPAPKSWKLQPHCPRHPMANEEEWTGLVSCQPDALPRTPPGFPDTGHWQCPRLPLRAVTNLETPLVPSVNEAPSDPSPMQGLTN